MSSIEIEHYELFTNEMNKLNKKDNNVLSEVWRLAIIEVNELISEKATEENIKVFCFDENNYPNIKKYQEALKHMKNALFNYAKLNLIIM